MVEKIAGTIEIFFWDRMIGFMNNSDRFGRLVRKSYQIIQRYQKAPFATQNLILVYIGLCLGFTVGYLITLI